MTIMNRPWLLLLGTGAALGLNFSLGKYAMLHGVSPALWAALISGGAGLALLAITQLTERQDIGRAPVLKFAVVSGLVSYVVPNFLTYLVIPQIGSGLTAVMFALSPVVTAFIAVALGVRPPNRLGVAGIATGLLGALTIIFSKTTTVAPGEGPWIFLAVLIPVFLGTGNIYRTLGWPRGASPSRLAALTNLAAVPFLLAISFLVHSVIDVTPLLDVPAAVITQLMVSTAMFLMFFRLQQIGGPTYLSQIGYVAAAVGVVVGVVLLGETYPPSVWLGAAVVAVGVALSTLGQFKRG